MTTGDEHFYALVADELETEQLDKGAWTKALAQTGFDKDRGTPPGTEGPPRGWVTPRGGERRRK